MTKRVLFVALALALAASLVAPLAAMAGTTDISGTLEKTATLTAPSNASFTTFILGDNMGSATAGSVVANGSGWMLTVTDGKVNNNGHMTIGGAVDSGAIALNNAIGVGMTSGSVGDISTYREELQHASGYGTVGTFSIPLYFKQTVVSDDIPGAYKITLTFTATPGT